MHRYFVFAAYGCWEARAETRFSTFESLEQAATALENWTNRFQEGAKREAQLINREPSLQWTSEEYYVGFLLRVQESLLPADRAVTHIDDLEPVIDDLGEQGESIRGLIVEVRGATLSENGDERRAFTKDDVLTIFLQ
jgi:hypothetical protein